MVKNLIWNFYLMTPIKNKNLYSLAFIVLAFCGISYFFFDQPIAMLMQGQQSTNLTLDQFFNTITLLGKSSLYFFIFGLAYFISRLRKQDQGIRYSLFALSSLIFTSLVCEVLKFLLGRSRPNLFFSNHIYGFHFFKTQALMLSCPSGHAMTIAAAMMILYLIKPRYWFVYLCIALLIGLSRIYLTAHFLSDVLGGFMLGMLSVNFCAHYAIKKGWLS